MLKTFIAFLGNERGVTSIEYAVIAGLVSVIIIGGVTVIGSRINSKFLGPVASGLS